MMMIGAPGRTSTGAIISLRLQASESRMRRRARFIRKTIMGRLSSRGAQSPKEHKMPDFRILNYHYLRVSSGEDLAVIPSVARDLGERGRDDRSSSLLPPRSLATLGMTRTKMPRSFDRGIALHDETSATRSA